MKKTIAKGKSRLKSRKGTAKKATRLGSAAFEALTGRVAALSEAQLNVFRAQFTDAQCDAWGGRTKAPAVYGEASAWALRARAPLAEFADTIRYSPTRFAWFVRCVTELGRALTAERAASGGAGTAHVDLAHAEHDAVIARDDLVAALLMLSKGDTEATRAVRQTHGTADNVQSLEDALDALADMGAAWLARTDEHAQVLLEAHPLTPSEIDHARRAATALRAAHQGAVVAPRSAHDSPKVNRAEGRVLREMDVLMDAFERAHGKNRLVPRLVPARGTRAVLSSGHGHATSAAPSEPTGSGAGAGATDPGASATTNGAGEDHSA